MKPLRVLIGMVFVVCLMPLQALAEFDLGHLVQVVYKNDDVEIGKDLLDTQTFSFSQQNVQVAPPGTFSLSQFATTNSWGDLRVAFFSHWAGQVAAGKAEAYFSTILPTTPTIGTSSLLTFIGGSSGTGTYYRNEVYDANKDIAVGVPTYPSAYNVNMNGNGNSPGYFAGYNKDKNGEASLEALATTGYVDMFLYKFNLNQPVAGPNGTPYLAILRVMADGSTILNPTGGGGGQAPQIADIADAGIAVATAYTGPTPTLSQGDGTIIWSLVSGPAGMTIDATTGAVFWDYSTTSGSPYTVTIKATNTAGADEESWQLTVTGSVSVAPIIIDIADASVSPGTAYTGPTPSLSQGSGTITWSLVSSPTGMTINADTGVVSWTSPTETGSPHAITIKATNSAGSDEESWQLTVSATATAPVIGEIADGSAVTATAYTGPTPSLSQGSGAITWSLVTGPSGMTIDAATGVVTWSSPTATGSPHAVTIKATNSSGSDEESWALTVSANTAAPVIAEIANHSTSVTSPYAGPLPTLKQGNPPVTWTLVEGSATMTINAATGMVSWATPVKSESPVRVTIRATTSSGSDDETWILTVETTRIIISPIPDATCSADAPYHGPKPELVQGELPIAWSLLNGPGGMSIGTSTGIVTWPQPRVETVPYTVTLKATNAAGSVLESYKLTVVESAVTPVITDPADETTIAGKPYAGPLPVLSAGTQPITWTLVSAPAGMEINVDTGVVTWAAAKLNSVPFAISLRATNTAGSGEATFELRVINNAPGDPSINYPAHQSEVNVAQPLLSVNNATDADGQPLTYHFELFEDSTGSQLVTSAKTIAEGQNTTSWSVDTALEDNRLYYWRARAHDGYAYSQWTAVSEFFVNITNDAPSTPGISQPADGAGVTETKPTLVLTHAVDPDRDPLTYEFEIYADEPMTRLVTSTTAIASGAEGSTAWICDVELEDGSEYWWRARARDNENLAGEWSEPVSFHLTVNQAPTNPTLKFPADEAEVDTLSPELIITNASDEENSALSYFFETDRVNTFDSTDLQRSAPLSQGNGPTTSWRPMTLADDTTWYWRVRAFDGEVYSDWVQGSFRVNQFNDPPGIPTKSSPGENTQVTTVTPTLTVQPAADPDNDDIVYDYELYADAWGNVWVAGKQNGGTSWMVLKSLTPGGYYYWRTRSVDEHGAASAWSGLTDFYVNVSAPPSAPVLNNPISGGVTTSLTPDLSVVNAIDLNADGLTYAFELYSDADLFYYVASGTVNEGIEVTSWRVTTPLVDGKPYYWRARAYDGELAGSWTPTASFTVNTLGAETLIETAVTQLVSAMSQATQTVAVSDTGSPLYGVTLEIPPGALSEDSTLTIGYITNPPALEDDMRPCGKVIYLGPSGLTFNTPVHVMIPLTDALLSAAGTEDPSEIDIFTYNSLEGVWEEVTDVTIWERPDENGVPQPVLIGSVTHFSMYSAARTLDTQAEEPTASEGGGGGGGCFIDSLNDGASDFTGCGTGLLTVGVCALFLWQGAKTFFTQKKKMKK